MLQCKTKNLYFKKKLGDLILFLRNGISNEQVDIYTDFPVTRIETIADGKIDYNRVGHVEKAPEDYRILQWDILVSNINSQKHIGKVAIKDDDKVLYHGMNLLLMRPNETIDSKFLFYVLNFNKQYFERIASPAVNQSSINQIDMQKMEFIIPKDKSKQEQIANILSTCDEVIEKTEETIEKYKQIKAGMMQDLFTRGLDENGKLRPTYAQAPDLYKYSKELDRYIPKEWNADKLDNLFTYTVGGDVDRPCFSEYKTSLHKYPIFANAVDNEGLYGYSSKFVINCPAITIAGRGVNIGTVFYRDAFFTPIVRLVVAFPNECLKILFASIALSRIKFESEATGIPQLTVPMVKKYKMAYPKNKEEQQNIYKYLHKIDLKLDKEEQYLNKYKQIKQGLMKQLLTPPADAEFVEE